MTYEMQIQSFEAAQRLLAEAGQHQGRVRRTLERLSAVYFWRAVSGMQGSKPGGNAPLPAAAHPGEGQGRA
jgi:hypothetical protein